MRRLHTVDAAVHASWARASPSTVSARRNACIAHCTPCTDASRDPASLAASIRSKLRATARCAASKPRLGIVYPATRPSRLFFSPGWKTRREGRHAPLAPHSRV